jgi:hypothetical protein
MQKGVSDKCAAPFPRRNYAGSSRQRRLHLLIALSPLTASANCHEAEKTGRGPTLSAEGALRS